MGAGVSWLHRGGCVWDTVRGQQCRAWGRCGAAQPNIETGSCLCLCVHAVAARGCGDKPSSTQGPKPELLSHPACRGAAGAVGPRGRRGQGVLAGGVEEG